MKQKKIPMRSCVVTKEKFPKKELIRIVKDKEGNVFVDETGRLNGHGAYLKLDKEVLETAKKTKVLDRYLEVEIKDEIYDEIERIIDKN